MAVFVAAIRIADHPSNGVADRHKGSLTKGSLPGRFSLHPHFDRYRSIFKHNSLIIEPYLLNHGAMSRAMIEANWQGEKPWVNMQSTKA
jgi:hypothetical protein